MEDTLSSICTFPLYLSLSLSVGARARVCVRCNDLVQLFAFACDFGLGCIGFAWNFVCLLGVGLETLMARYPSELFPILIL